MQRNIDVIFLLYVVLHERSSIEFLTKLEVQAGNFFNFHSTYICDTEVIFGLSQLTRMTGMFQSILTFLSRQKGDNFSNNNKNLYFVIFFNTFKKSVKTFFDVKNCQSYIYSAWLRSVAYMQVLGWQPLTSRHLQ